MSEPQGSLRKAAILISSLDTQSADRLLDQMGPAQAAKVRDAVMELNDFDTVEQDAVIQEFLGRPGTLPATLAKNSNREEGVELDISLTRKMNDTGTYQPRRHATSFATPPSTERKTATSAATPTFQAILNASAEKLATYLERENPQLIALVMVHLPPARAAEVLSFLSPTLQSDVIQRVANVNETNLDVLQDVESELNALLQVERLADLQPSAGMTAARAILAASKSSVRSGVTAQLQSSDLDLATKLGLKNELPPPLRTIDFDDGPYPIKPATKPTTPKTASSDQRHPTRVEERASEREEDVESRNDTQETNNSTRTAPTPSGPQLSFEDVAQFDNRSLAFVLRNVEPQLAILALAGADPSLIERILKQLPARDARAFRTRLRQIGPLRVSDVLESQNEFARTASHLISKGILRSPTPKKLPLAA